MKMQETVCTKLAPDNGEPMSMACNAGPASGKRARFNRLSIARLAAAAGMAVALFAVGASAAHADQIDDYVHTEMAKKKIPGMSLAVIRDGKVIKESAYGLASIELNVPMTLDTSFVLASMSKVFTASAVMLLVQDGKITLDEPVIKILPQLPAAWSGITIRNCLSHTSGIPDVMVDDINITTVAADREEMFEKLGTLPVHPIGQEVAYNQTGYALLGMVIEKISGMSYDEFMQKRVLAPSKMTHAKFGDSWAVIPGRSDLYTADEVTKDHTKLQVRDGRPVTLTDKILRYGAKSMPDYLAPAGLLNGSIGDLVNWEQTMEQGKLLTGASLHEMTKPYKLNNGKNGDFGLSFMIIPVGPFQTVSYGGGAAAWRFSIPEKHLTVIVLTNLQGSQPQSIAAEIMAMYEPSIAAEVSR
jgi:D-alanyl-D-alanine carboxypeptidase